MRHIKVTTIILLFSSSSLLAEEVFSTVSEFEFVSPSSVKELTKEQVTILSGQGCTIPKWSYQFGGVTVGSFAKSGQKDTAVICHKEGPSTIKVFWGGPNNCPDTLISNGQFISTVGKKYIMDRYSFYGGNKPPQITHEAINDHIVEKASSVSYCHNGQWIELTGAD